MCILLGLFIFYFLQILRIVLCYFHMCVCECVCMHVCKCVDIHVCKHACGGLGLMLGLILLLNVRVSQSNLDLTHMTSLI